MKKKGRKIRDGERQIKGSNQEWNKMKQGEEVKAKEKTINQWPKKKKRTKRKKTEC